MSERYFTGKPCKRGHIAERLRCDNTCVECNRLKWRKQQPTRRAYFREHMRRYRRKYPERIRATEARRDKAARAADRRARRADGREDYKSALRRSYQRRKAKSRKETAAWRNSNRERHRMHMRACKARRRAAEGRFTADDIRALMIKQRGLCVCGVDISEKYEVDHIIPLARGGTNWPDNLQLMCQPCNRSKGATMTAAALAPLPSDRKSHPH